MSIEGITGSSLFTSAVYPIAHVPIYLYGLFLLLRIGGFDDMKARNPPILSYKNSPLLTPMVYMSEY